MKDEFKEYLQNSGTIGTMPIYESKGMKVTTKTYKIVEEYDES